MFVTKREGRFGLTCSSSLCLVWPWSFYIWSPLMCACNVANYIPASICNVTVQKLCLVLQSVLTVICIHIPVIRYFVYADCCRFYRKICSFFIFQICLTSLKSYAPNSLISQLYMFYINFWFNIKLIMEIKMLSKRQNNKTNYFFITAKKSGTLRRASNMPVFCLYFTQSAL